MRPSYEFGAGRSGRIEARDLIGQERNMTAMIQSFDWEGTLEVCNEMLRDDPDHLGALETLAKAQWLGGHYKDVIYTTNRLLRLNPHEPGYRYTRGMAYLSMGHLRRSADDLRMAFAQSKDVAFRNQVSSALDAVELWLAEEPVRMPGMSSVGSSGHHSSSMSSLRVH